MNRRTFGQLLASIGLGLTWGKVKRVRRFYSVKLGHQGVCLLHGRQVPYAISCKTGPNGWVKYFVESPNGSIAMFGNAPAIGRSRGPVEFLPREGQKLMNRLHT